jgi:hypothetical protein
VPEVALLPVQPPEAVQEVASVDDHVRFAAAPEAIDVLSADSVSVGGVAEAPCIVTVALRETAPLEPVHESEKLVADVSAEVTYVPLVACDPDQPPLAVQELTLVAVQLSWAVEPEATCEGVAEIERVAVLPGSCPLGTIAQFG